MQCKACQGRGKIPHPYTKDATYTCLKCKGKRTMPDEQLQNCPTCKGKGHVLHTILVETVMCPDCLGTGKLTASKVIIPEVVGPVSITESKPPEWKGPVQVKQERTITTTQTQHQVNIEKFMRGAEQKVPDTPVQPFPNNCLLRARLIIEEALETVEALGIRVWVGHELVNSPRKGKQKSGIPTNVTFDLLGKFNMQEVADGCADLSVVTIGTLSACGIKDHKLLEEVDKSNIAKIEGGHKDEHGKWIKPTDWTAPDIMGILKAQGYKS